MKYLGMDPVLFWALCVVIAYITPLAVARIRRNDDLLVIVRVDVAVSAACLISVLPSLCAPVFLARALYRSLLWSNRDVDDFLEARRSQSA